MILITGATGTLGDGVITHLLEKGAKKEDIIGLARSDEKAGPLRDKGVQVRFGDYDDYGSLENAFDGVDTLLFISASEIPNRLSQHENVVKAAKNAGVAHIVYTSFTRKNESETSPIWSIAESHLATEKWLKESGIGHTILKNNLYMDFIPGFVGDKVLETGTIYLPAGKGKVSTALRDEFAEAIATILLGPKQEKTVYDFTNVEAYDYEEIASYISDITGREITYHSPSLQAYSDTLKEAGVPAEVTGIFGRFAAAQAQGELDTVSHDLEKLLGRKPTSLKDYLAQVYGG